MSTRKFLVTLLMVMGFSLSIAFRGESEEFKLVPKKRAVSDVQTVSGTQVGTGWSTKENPQEAVKEAVEMALEGKKDRTPDFAVIFASSGSDMEAIFSKAQELFKNKTKIYGGSSDSRAVMTNRGFAKATERAYEYARMGGKRSLAIMTVTSKDIIFGVGSANLPDYPSIQEGAKAALLKAIKSAGKSPKELPQAILITPARGLEEEETSFIVRWPLAAEKVLIDNQQ
jgi:hypothetical protein